MHPGLYGPGGAGAAVRGESVSRRGPLRAKMAVDKDLLQLDLYGLLGVGEKASEKEVRAAGREPSGGRLSSLPPRRLQPGPSAVPSAPAAVAQGRGRLGPGAAFAAPRVFSAVSLPRCRLELLVSGKAQFFWWGLCCSRLILPFSPLQPAGRDLALEGDRTLSG